MGGEAFALVWQEDRLPSGEVVGEPRLDYARLELGGRTLELVASSATGPVLVFEDGEVVQRSAPPILGARLSSVFGKRNHPVLGGVRMHTGIDFAAPVGTEVNATGSGRVVFAGTIRGYGLTVDMDHGGGVVTRYAHLSEIADGVAPGRRLKAGDTLGAVGATGLVSGPNLHYEVRLDGAPVDPMDQNALPEEIIASAEDLDALTRWRNATGYTNAEKEG
jgi:murein DD-endopeptidase MepM/ murein hydrolase activator NlpD